MPRGLLELLQRYGIEVESEAAAKIPAYIALLEKWNPRVNLTASTGWEALAPLVEEAIWASESYPKRSTRHLDIGSGAGFPALLIRILRPRMRLTMVESRARRAAFLEEAADELDLEGTAVYNGRLEEFLRSDVAAGWDFVSWKAVRLERRELAALCARCDESTRFWVFHGTSLPFDFDPGDLFEAEGRRLFPGKNSWFLSVMRKPVSRETG